jgi:hypothetical protein
VRDNCPAINVKDRTLWAQNPRLTRAYDDLGESTIAQLYEISVEDFWQEIVPALAREHGYDPENIFSAGRSGGWLTVRDQLWPGYAVDPFSNRMQFEIPPADATADDDTRAEYAEMIAERDRFLRFAQAIEQGMDAAGESFVERCLDAVRELDAARENAIVRGEN